MRGEFLNARQAFKWAQYLHDENYVRRIYRMAEIPGGENSARQIFCGEITGGEFTGGKIFDHCEYSTKQKLLI